MTWRALRLSLVGACLSGCEPGSMIVLGRLPAADSSLSAAEDASVDAAPLLDGASAGHDASEPDPELDDEEQVPCKLERDCQGLEEERARCSPSLGRCVECLADGDCTFLQACSASGTCMFR